MKTKEQRDKTEDIGQETRYPEPEDMGVRQGQEKGAQVRGTWGK